MRFLFVVICIVMFLTLYNYEMQPKNNVTKKTVVVQKTVKPNPPPKVTKVAMDPAEKPGMANIQSEKGGREQASVPPEEIKKEIVMEKIEGLMKVKVDRGIGKRWGKSKINIGNSQCKYLLRKSLKNQPSQIEGKINLVSQEGQSFEIPFGIHVNQVPLKNGNLFSFNKPDMVIKSVDYHNGELVQVIRQQRDISNNSDVEYIVVRAEVPENFSQVAKLSYEIKRLPTGAPLTLNSVLNAKPRSKFRCH